MPKAKAAPPPQPVLAPDGVLRKLPKKPCIPTYQANDKKEFMFCFKHRPLKEISEADRRWLWTLTNVELQDILDHAPGHVCLDRFRLLQILNDP